ncbi:glycine cleavage system protein R [Nitrospira sp. Kam-Ns4a]
MTCFAMLTAFGQDRPGMVAALAEGLFRLGCNIEDTCMTRLRGEFAMMLMVRLPPDLPPDRLADRLAPHTAPLHLTLLCREIPAEVAARRGAREAEAQFILSVYGADQPGIVAQVARCVADHGGNITDMNTRVIGAPDRPVYVMILEVHLPPESSPDALQEALDRLKPALSVDVTFRPLERVEL